MIEINVNFQSLNRKERLILYYLGDGSWADGIIGEFSPYFY